MVDLVDDLQMSRQNLLEQMDWPALQRLWHQSVVRVTARCLCYGPRFIPAQVVLVYENPHHLRDGQRGMRVVQLNCRVVCQTANIRMVREESADDVTQRRRHQKVF